MGSDDVTKRTYEDSAAGLAEHYDSFGPRIDDIKRGLKLAPVEDGAKVVEIGCGNGRDAAEIVKLVDRYEGFDPSAALLDIARGKIPGANFVQADALSYEYPSDIDVAFAFASLLHVSKDEFASVLSRVSKSLRKNGIFYIALKLRDEYKTEVKKDKYGERKFYFYNPEIIKGLAGDKYESVYESTQEEGGDYWFTIALKGK